jgi:tRNA(Ile)-lysidine synthase
VAVHCNHGLQPGAADWEAHCGRLAAAAGVSFVARRLAVAADDRRGIEAAAREARYAALLELMADGDTLLSAHHEDDQAETLILNLMRGSGAGGVAGIGAMQPFGPGRLCRPLLDVPRRALLHYAREAGVDWIDDPSNADTRFDRNWLRQEVMPRLEARWPGAAAGLRRSAGFASEASALLNELADLDLAKVGLPGQAGTIDVTGLRGLSPERQRNVLRRALARCGLPPAPSTRLIEAVETLLPASRDAQPLVRWPGAELRRYRDRLFLLRSPPASPPARPLVLPVDGTPLALGPGLGSLHLSADDRGGISRERVGDGLEVRFRDGGERLRPHGRQETHRLKKLLQDQGILPWMRAAIPLLYADGALVAVADIWVDHAAWRAPGLAVRWESRPRLT